MPQPHDPKPFPPELGQAVSAIALASAVLGLFCLYDALREALGAYQYHTDIPLLGIYKGVLGIYAATRQAHQWNDPDAKASLGGRYFLLAWLAVPVFLNALEVGRLWYPPPIQPAELNNTLNWVVGYYVFGKASTLARMNGLHPLGLGKTLDARKAALAKNAPETTPPSIAVMAELKLAVDVLGAVCIFDVLREAISPPNQSYIDVHFAYRLALTAYAGTNQWRKWTDPKADAPRRGYVWILAWLAALALIKGLELSSPDNIIVMPTHLPGTLLWVFSIYALGHVSNLALRSGLNPWRQAPAGETPGPDTPPEEGPDRDALAAAILDALEGETNGLTIGQIAAKIGDKKGDLKRPLKTLVDNGDVIKLAVTTHDPNTRYKLAKYP